MAIDPLKFNYIRYGNLERENTGEKTAAEKQQAQSSTGNRENREIPSDKIFEYLVQSSYIQAPEVKSLDVSKYVTEEQAQRIAGYVREFQQSIDKTMEAVESEFPNLQDSAKVALAVELFNAGNLR